MTYYHSDNTFGAIIGGLLIAGLIAAAIVGIITSQQPNCQPVTFSGAADYSAHVWSADGHVLGYSSEEDSVIWNERGCITER